MTEVDPALRADARWQLIERIVASPPFQKSARLRDLLCYLAERTLHGQSQDLSEHRIGSAVFGKAQDYSVVEDSSVRVHVRQLRLKLHEYFDGEGRAEALVVEIPKGAYTTLFRAVEHEAAVDPTATDPGMKSWFQLLPWALAALFLTTTFFAWFRHPAVPKPTPPPWPLAALFDSTGNPVQVVVADINYGMMRLVDEQSVTLEQYLSASYRSVRSARELRPRDLEQGAFVFVGSPSSNPWVSYFQDKLNFQEREGVVGESLKFFQNQHPRPGEQATYQGLAFTGSSGEDYATISLLPLANGRGSVLILQGLQQEGTEAAGLFMADAGNRQKLQEALGFSGSPTQPVYFEALIRTQAVAGAPNATSIVSTRVIHP